MWQPVNIAKEAPLATHPKLDADSLSEKTRLTMRG
jgi:hypothetical protein